MLWNLLGLQRKLDTLFDEGWIRLGIDYPDMPDLGIRDLLDEWVPTHSTPAKAAPSCEAGTLTPTSAA